MNVIKNENVIFCDIDDTLILHLSDEELKNMPTVEVPDPITMGVVKVGIHRPMVRLLREEHHRGSHVIVWSKGGYEWAANVIKALYLDDYVHQIMSKPNAYFDDKPIDEWLKHRVYLKPEAVYKNVKYKRGE